ncbi:MAG: cell division protein SepF [Tissierellia bacterium]|nr:cell division protein SepF [Tissierellia bacterium]
MAGLFDKLKGVIGIEEEYYDDDYEYEEKRSAEESESVASSYKAPETESSYAAMDKATTKRSNIVSLQSNTYDRQKINIHEPITFDDGPHIIDDIVSRKVVVLNLEMLETDKKRQIFDFVSGGIYALDGKIQKVTKDIFVIAPKDVEIDGKLKEQIQAKGFYQL